MRQKVGNENSAWKCQALENSNWVVLSTLSLMSWVRRAWLSGQHTLGFGLQTGQGGQPSDQGNTETHPVPVCDTWISGSLPGLLLSIN